MAMLNYQQEVALYKLNPALVKTSTDYDYFEMLDLFRQLEMEGYVNFSNSPFGSGRFEVSKTSKGQLYHYNWLHSEFR